MRAIHAMLAIAAGSLVAVPAMAQPTPAATTASRPAADIAADALRKPAEMLAFAEVKPGQTIVEMLPGGGYFTRLFSTAVGPKGKVIAVLPEGLVKARPQALDGMKTLAAEPGRANIAVSVTDLRTLAPAGSADLVWTSRNYHDMHGPQGPADQVAAVNKAAFEALKPGGLYVVLDHAAAPGSGLRDVATLHRIDPAVVKKEVVAAGFQFDGESKAVANPADDHTKAIFDPALRGHTDQFVYRFRKPR
jgi:predicted methyltransferase